MKLIETGLSSVVNGSWLENLKKRLRQESKADSSLRFLNFDSSTVELRTHMPMIVTSWGCP
jgi:hypothetical protein